MDLPGIGTFTLDAAAIIPQESDRVGQVPATGIRFANANIPAADDALITFIKEHTGKMKSLAAADLDFYLTTGFMPLQDPQQQPWRRRVEFTPKEIAAITQYVASLGPGPSIPRPDPSAGSVSVGFHLFTEHCAGCHQAVAEGGYVTNVRVPKLKQDTATQIAEAVRIGPNLMPVFSKHDISDRQLNSIIAYIESVKHPNDRGGWGIGHIGPVPEGMFTWLVAAVALVALCVLIGERLGKA